MASVVYIDVDDEITSAAARIRGSDDGPVALVVPSGSRVATSRINFRLLAREAQSHGRRLSIVAGDGATRALAASAGLPVFGSVGEYEGATGPDAAHDDGVDVLAPASRPEPRTSPSPARPRSTGPLAASRATARPAPVAAAAIPVVAGASAAGDAATVALPLPRPAAAPRPSFVLPRDRRAIAAGAVAVAIVVLGIAAFLLLPSASIALTPREEPMSPLIITVRADPDATASDPAAGVVPAQRLSFDLAASDTFPVKGRHVEEATATGRVTFRSKDYLRENRIVAGSIVSTPSSVRFRTTATVVIARAHIVGFIIVPGQASVGVEAVEPGTDGNVDANTITVIPRGEDPLFLDVRNREPTTGGKHDETPKVDQADVDAAIAQLTKQLGDDFETLIAEPARIPPGMTVFPDTRAIAVPEPTTDTAALVGQEVESFELDVHSTGTVVGVKEAAVRSLAADRLTGTIDAGHRVVDGSVDIEVGGATVSGESVTFPVTANARRVPVLDTKAIEARIKGRPIPQARSILAEYGDAQIRVWPDWVSSIPTIDARIDLHVAAATNAPTPTPTGP